MYIKKVIIFILLLVILGSCAKKQSEVSIRKKVSPAQRYEFKLYDSIAVDYLAGSLLIVDMTNRGLFLGLDFLDKTILLFNRSGKIINKFNRVGSDPVSFGSFLYALGFYDNTTVSVLSERGITFYSLNGEFIRNLPYRGEFAGFQMNNQLQLRPVTINDTTYLLALMDSKTKYRITDKEFYDEVHYFTMINTITNNQKKIVQIEENDIYKNGKYFYPSRIIPVFSVDRKRNLLKVKYPLGENLYTYSLEGDIKLSRITNLQPEHLKEPVGVPFENPEKDPGFSINGFYRNIFVNQDTTFLVYTTHFDTDKFTNDTGLNFFENPVKYYNAYNHRYTATYCQVFVNDEKVCQDIPLPPEASYIAWISGYNYVIMKKGTSMLNYEPDNEMFYVYKIVPVAE